MLRIDCSACSVCNPHALPGGKTKKSKSQSKAEFFVWKYHVNYMQNCIGCWSPDNLYFQFTCMLLGEHNSIYQNVPQGRWFFKRNNSAVSTDLKAMSQTTCHLNLTWFSAEVFSAIVLILRVRIYPITRFLTRKGEKNNLFQYFSSLFWLDFFNL